MKHIKVLELSEANRLELEKGYHNGPTHNYQSVSKAREAWEKASGKKTSDITFKRFLGALVQDISE